MMRKTETPDTLVRTLRGVKVAPWLRQEIIRLAADRAMLGGPSLDAGECAKIRIKAAIDAERGIAEFERDCDAPPAAIDKE